MILRGITQYNNRISPRDSAAGMPAKADKVTGVTVKHQQTVGEKTQAGASPTGSSKKKDGKISFLHQRVFVSSLGQSG